MDTKSYDFIAHRIVISSEFGWLSRVTQVGTHRSQMIYMCLCGDSARNLAWEFDWEKTKSDCDKARLLALSSQLYKITEFISGKSVQHLGGFIEVIPVHLLSTKEEKIRESLKHLAEIYGSDYLPDGFLESFYQMFEDDDFDPSEINEVNICKYTRKLIDLQFAIAEKTTNGKDIPRLSSENFDFALSNKKLLYTEETCRLFDEYYQ